MKVKDMAEEAGMLVEDTGFAPPYSWTAGGWNVQFDPSDGTISLTHERDIWYLSSDGAGELAEALLKAKEKAYD